MRIGELAAASGASARSLRYYESLGLLASTRSVSGQRHYPPTAVERVRLIKSLLGAGLSTATISDILPCITDETARTPLLAARLDEELHALDEQIRALRRTRTVLADVAERYRTTG